MKILLLLLISLPYIVFCYDTTAYEWKSVPIGGGGLVSGLVTHPAQKDLVYARTDVGGAYRWQPSSKTWIPLMDMYNVSENHLFGVESIAVDPSDVNRVYVSTGQYSWTKHSFLMSNDQGKTWTIAAKFPPVTQSNTGYRTAGERLCIDPQDGTRMWYGSRTSGLWQSTDRGLTWNSAPFPNNGTKDVGILFVIHDSSHALYAGVYNTGVYRSTNDGATWDLITGGTVKPIRAAAPSSGVVYISADDGVWKYSKGVMSYITPPKNVSRGFSGIAAHSFQTYDQVIVGESKFASSNPIWVSVDSGSTWNRINNTKVNRIPWWDSGWFNSATSAIGIDYLNPYSVWLPNWLGIFHTEDWRQGVWNATVKGLEELVPHDLTSPPSGKNFLVSAIADASGFAHSSLDSPPNATINFSGFFNKQNGQGWVNSCTSVDFAEEKPNLMVVATVIGDPYGGAGYSNNSGDTWANFPKLPANPINGGQIVISAKGSNILWLPQNSDTFWYTRDLGQTWGKTTGGPGTVILGYNEWNGQTKCLAADRVNDNKFYLVNKNIFYASTNGGSSWTVASNGTFAWDQYNVVRASPAAEGDVWISAGNKFWRTQNSGATIVRVAPTVTSILAWNFGMAAPGSNDPSIYLYGTVENVVGVWMSTNLGQTWTYITGVSNPIGVGVQSIVGDRQTFGRVFVASSGRGIFYGVPRPIPSTTDTSDPESQNNTQESNETQYNTPDTQNSDTEDFSSSGSSLAACGFILILSVLLL